MGAPRTEAPAGPGSRHAGADPAPRGSRGPWNAVYDAWSDAHEEAEGAWRTWRSGGGREAYLAYRAAADREDAAQDALAAASRAAAGRAPALGRQLGVREADALAAVAVDDTT